ESVLSWLDQIARKSLEGQSPLIPGYLLNWLLSPVRLPVPPLRRVAWLLRVYRNRRPSNKFAACVAFLCGAAVCFAQGPAGRYPNLRVRPRVIATTDGEVDDRCSMVRFLMFANEFQIEGLIHSSSRFHWLGQTWSGVEWINGQL